MKIKTMASSIVCCIVLSSNSADAFEEQKNPVNLLEVSNKDERILMEDCTLRKGASQFAIEIKVIPKNSKVEVLEEQDKWAKVKFENEVGFLKLENIKKVNTQVSVKYLDGIEYLDVYSDMSGYESRKIGKIKNNERVFIIEELGQYIRIRWNGEEGYIKNIQDCLVKKIKKVVSENTEIYSKLTNKSVYKKISKGEVVEIEEVLAEYYKVNYKNEVGYIRKGTLKDEKYVGVKNLNSIKMHVSASDTSNIRTYVPSGSNVEVMGYKGEYAYIKYGGYVGYIRINDLSKEEIKLIELSRKEIVSKRLINREKVEAEYALLIEDAKDEKEFNEKFDEFKKKFGLVEISEGRDIKVLKNRGRYLEAKIDGNRYYVNNKGIYVEDEKKELTYIHVEPKIETKSNTRYIGQMDTEVYLEKDKKVLLGMLVKDAQIEIIEDLEDNMSKVLLNGSEVYIETEKITENKMYTKVERQVSSFNTGKSHKIFVETQNKKLNTVVKNTGNEKANIEELAYYSNPNNMSVWDNQYKYQYLKLDEFRMINAKKLNEYLNAIPDVAGKKNIFKDKADVFISAAKKYDIDPVYLVAHTLLETGKGKSKLAQGQLYGEGVTVYNLFGIGAVDSNPLNGGKATAYKNGWTSIDKAIEGSAKWLSDNYINLRVNKQNTLYKMRYNYMTKTHQYATDIAWCVKISKYMNELSYLYEDAVLVFEVPKYNRGTYLAGMKNYKEDERKEIENIDDENEEEIDDEEEKTPAEEKPEEKPPVEEKPEEKPPVEEKPPAEEKPEEKPPVEEKPPAEEKPPLIGEVGKGDGEVKLPLRKFIDK